MVPDRLIPPTMLVGLTPPAMVESIIFLILLGVLVDPVLLFGCAIATVLGGLVGAPLVARARVWIVQLIVAIGLVLAAAAYAMTNLHLFPGGGTATGLPPALTIVAIIANFGFGILANFGVGNYAPTLVMLSLMGMDPRLCFPIMAAGGSLMGAGASVRHIAIGEVDLRIVLGLAIGGIPAVLVAAFIVKEMPLEILRWLVFVGRALCRGGDGPGGAEGPARGQGRSGDRAVAVACHDRPRRAQPRLQQLRPGAQGAHLSPGRARERRVRRGLRDRHARPRAVPARRCAATRRASPRSSRRRCRRSASRC